MSLTIKQAFEALSDACANGMKNPFFVMRRLKESFADVASKVVDASGDKVTVTPITNSGTKIAEIKVNNTTSELYAPNQLHNYSTTEQIVGKWIDGNDVVEITLTGLSTVLNSTAWVTLSESITDALIVLDVKAFRGTDTLSSITLSETQASNGTVKVAAYSGNTSTISTAIVRYVKST